jgi:1,4-alpha-glucan branching enzyme
MPIDLSEVGAEAVVAADDAVAVRFGVYLPGITFDGGYRLQVKVIHERDQFVREIPPVSFWLDWVKGSELDLWTATVDLDDGPGHFGDAGTHLYRFQLLRAAGDGEQPVTPQFADPFGRAAGLGTLSAFTVGAAPAFAWTDQDFRVPEVDDMVVYELHVGEFNSTFDGVVDQLDYLTGLGVNVLELMPVTNVGEDVEWGYTPLGYFAPDDRYGGPDAFRRLVDACHTKGVAVVLDAVYAHAHPDFAYNVVYQRTGVPDPMMGPFAGEFFGSGRPGTDYTKPFTRDFFLQVNRFWLTQYHVDGFRYDYVPGIWDGPTGVGYADLVFRTYQLASDLASFPRFDSADDGRSLIVQCAENLPDPRGTLSTTYSNTAWQNELFDRAREQVRSPVALTAFAHLLDPGLVGYPDEYRNPAADDVLPVAPFQYLESHDHGRFVAEFGTEPITDVQWQPYGDRSRWAKTQPYVVALYTAKGVPMLWQGQEFAENWTIPGGTDPRRTLFSRPLHWEYFYDRAGKALVRLYRRLGELRREHRALGSRGDFFYFDDESHRRAGLIAYRRQNADESLVVVLNFSDAEQEAWIPWPHAGTWTEQLDGRGQLRVTDAGERAPVRVPSNYGAVLLRE